VPAAMRWRPPASGSPAGDRASDSERATCNPFGSPFRPASDSMRRPAARGKRRTAGPGRSAAHRSKWPTSARYHDPADGGPGTEAGGVRGRFGDAGARDLSGDRDDMGSAGNCSGGGRRGHGRLAPFRARRLALGCDCPLSTSTRGAGRTAAPPTRALSCLRRAAALGPLTPEAQRRKVRTGVRVLAAGAPSPPAFAAGFGLLFIDLPVGARPLPAGSIGAALHAPGGSATVPPGPYAGPSGGVAERLKAHAWRACMGATPSRVRIPLPPPTLH
jgi:hypothetical protein